MQQSIQGSDIEVGNCMRGPHKGNRQGQGQRNGRSLPILLCGSCMHLHPLAQLQVELSHPEPPDVAQLAECRCDGRARGRPSVM